MENTNRQIDLLRNAPGQMQVGGSEDGPIVAAITTKERLYFVKSHAIYSIQLADQIDPDRQNPNIPNTQQRELPIGSEDSEVARILLTAELLLKKTALGQSFDVERGIKSAFDLLKDIAALLEMRRQLEVSQQEAKSSHATQIRNHQTLRLPSIENIEAQCDAFAQKAAHVVNGLEDLAKIFYPTELTAKWVDALIRTVRKKSGDDSPFALYLGRTKPFPMFILEMRNMIEHPKPEEFINVYNFRLLPSGELAPTAVEIVRPDRPLETEVATVMMKSVTEQLVNVCEALFVNLCNANIYAIGAFASLSVIEVPPEQRRNAQIRFSYGYFNGHTMIPIAVG